MPRTETLIYRDVPFPKHEGSVEYEAPLPFSAFISPPMIRPVDMPSRPQNPVVSQPPSKEYLNLQKDEPLLLAAGPILFLLSTGLPTADKEVSVEQAPPLTEENPTCTLETSSLGFTARLEQVRPRIASAVYARWRGDFDVYELDNLIQAGLVGLWRAYERDKTKLEKAGDSYWYSIAKRGAYQEVCREHAQRVRRKGGGSSKQRQRVEVVINAQDILAQQHCNSDSDDTDEEDETLLLGDTFYRRETEEIRHIHTRLEVARLEHLIYTGTHESDHPLIGRILGYMREGLTQTEMAQIEGVRVATIQCTIRRMRQACGAAATVSVNHQQGRQQLDARIRTLREQKRSGTEIARLVGMSTEFVYRRLRQMNLVGRAGSGKIDPTLQFPG